MNINLNAEDVPEGWIAKDTEEGVTQISVPTNKGDESVWAAGIIIWSRGIYAIYPSFNFKQFDRDRAGWRRTITRELVRELKERSCFMKGPNQ